jgi:F-type H+-transporting ATPase subunit epsilon
MRVEIYSLKRILFEGDAQSVNCKTANGEITVLEKHEPLISMLEDGPVRIMPAGGGQEQAFAVKGGFIQVNPGHEVRLLVEE